MSLDLEELRGFLDETADQEGTTRTEFLPW